MPRPKKQTVDYFPHSCTHGKTMFILEQKYGNDGYAFWFKLLEILGSTEGHCLHFANGMDWEFLIAKTHLDKERCTEILNLLATLGAIDKELWKEQKVWSDNFIENIKEAYRNRIVEIPDKPSFLRKKSASKGNYDVNNPHIILDKSILDKNINSSDLKTKSEPKIVFNHLSEKWENIQDKHIDNWIKAYPACDIPVELAKMKQWILANGAKGHKSNWLKFIINWLSRSQDRGGTKNV